ncbi:MAG TPA: alpha/beta hydrolase-fold protein [Verrucomicrobiae bacterium]
MLLFGGLGSLPISDAFSHAHAGETKHVFEFEVTFPKETRADAFSGRVVIFLSKYSREPRYSDDWVSRTAVIGADFSRIQPGQCMWIADSNAVSYPVLPSGMERGRYFVQAVLDLGLSALPPGRSPGNLYSDPTAVLFGNAGECVRLICQHHIEREIKESAWSKLVRIESPRLSAFHNKPVFIQGKVQLPEAWQKEPERRFPLVLFIPGSGFSLEDTSRQAGPCKLFPEEPAVVLWLEAYGADGHGEFANSRNNGPWGEGLVKELIPEVESRFRCFGHREARLIRGHSAGGGAALRLMLTYPDVFGYAWASAPSPMDYRAVHGANIYEAGANLFYESDGGLRPLVQLFGSRPVAYFKDMSERDGVLGRAGFSIFEAICSRRGQDGRPEQLWDRKTGVVNPRVAADWREYDNGYQLIHRWNELKDKLSGRLRITVGQADEMGLAGPVALVQTDLRAIGADVLIEIGPGGHFPGASPVSPTGPQQGIFDRFKEWRDQNNRGKP